MQKVLFLHRSGPHWPGANPNLDDDKAKQLIEAGVCIPYTDEARAKIKELIGEEGQDIPPKTEVDLSQSRRRAERPAQVETSPLDELGLETRLVHALTSAGLADLAAVQKYAAEHENFLEVEGIGDAGNEQIQAALKKAARKR